MIGAVVLAAGRGERMGTPKGSIKVSGRSFVETILGTLEAAGVEAVRVVVAPRDAGEQVPLGDERRIVNPEPERGMLSSVRCGIRALPGGFDAVLLWPVDHPRVSAETVSALVAAWRGSGAPVVVPSFAGRRGHPALFDARAAGELFTAPDELGARAVVLSHDDRIELAVEDAAILDDIDTPADFERAYPGQA